MFCGNSHVVLGRASRRVERAFRSSHSQRAPSRQPTAHRRGGRASRAKRGGAQMTRAIAKTTLGLLLTGGAAWAQPAELPPPGSFTIHQTQASDVQIPMLLDTRTGMTWAFTSTPEGYRWNPLSYS